MQKKVIKHIWKSITAYYFNKLDDYSAWRISTKSMINKSYHNTSNSRFNYTATMYLFWPIVREINEIQHIKVRVYFRDYYFRFIRMTALIFFSFRKFWLGLPKHAWCQSELILRRARCRIPGRPVRYTESNITAASNGGSDGEQREGQRTRRVVWVFSIRAVRTSRKMVTVVSEGRDPRWKERRMEDKSRPTLAGKENIRSPFIFINKTSRRVRSSGN